MIFWPKIQNFAQKPNVGEKSKFLVKSPNFCSKIQNFGQKRNFDQK